MAVLNCFAQENVLWVISFVVLFWQITAAHRLKRKFVDIFQKVMKIKISFSSVLSLTVRWQTGRTSGTCQAFHHVVQWRFYASEMLHSGCATQAQGQLYCWSCRRLWSTSPHRLITPNDLAFNRPGTHCASQPIEHLCKYSKNFSWSLNLSFCHHFEAPPSTSTSHPSSILLASVRHCFIFHTTQVASLRFFSLVIKRWFNHVRTITGNHAHALRAKSHAQLRLDDSLNGPLIICSLLFHTWLCWPIPAWCLSTTSTVNGSRGLCLVAEWCS